MQLQEHGQDKHTKRVMHWVKRFPVRMESADEKQPGNGRKAHYQHQEDKEAVREAIRKSSPECFQSQGSLEEATGKQIKDGAFQNFLSLMAQDLDV